MTFVSLSTSMSFNYKQSGSNGPIVKESLVRPHPELRELQPD